MLVSQRSAYQLQQKLKELDAQEAMKLEGFSHPRRYLDLTKERQQISYEYNQKRQWLIWWYAHRNDLIAGLILLGVAGLGVYFVVG